MDGGRAWRHARSKFKDKVKPWEPIVMPSKSMPPRCALTPFTRSYGAAPTLTSQPDASAMVGARQARSDLLALSQYTPVGMVCKVLGLEAPNLLTGAFQHEMRTDFATFDCARVSAGSITVAQSRPFERRNLLILDDAEFAPAHSNGSSATMLFSKAELRRRPASAGPGGRPGPVAGHRAAEARIRPLSAHGSKGTPAVDRHAPIYKDPVSFARLRTTLDKCPESARLFKMLSRVEAKGAVKRTQAVFRPSSAPPSNAHRKPPFGVSPYAESPAAQLYTIERPPKQILRRPSSAVPGSRPSSSLGQSLHDYSTLHSSAGRQLPGQTSKMRLTYIPPRPLSAAARMRSSDVESTSGTFSAGENGRGFQSRHTSASGVSYTQHSTLRRTGVGAHVSTAHESSRNALDGQQRRQRVAADFVRLLCAEAGKCINESGADWERDTMIWRRHPSAYIRIPHYLKEQGDLLTLGHMLTDAHFITRGLICNGAQAMLASMNTAVAAMTVAVQQEMDAGGPQHGSSLRRLSRMKHFQTFIRQHAVALDKEPFRFFVLAFKEANWGAQEHVGRKEPTEGAPQYVAYQVQRSLQDAAQSIEMIASTYWAASPQEEEQDGKECVADSKQPGTPATSLRHAIVLHEYLKMLLAHGCLECLSASTSKKAHDLIDSISQFISRSASVANIKTPANVEISALPDFIHAMLLDLDAKESPSLSESLSLAPSSITRQIYLDLRIPLEALNTDAAIEDMKRVIRRDAASALGVDSDDLEVDRMTSTSARLVCNRDVAGVSSSLGMDPSYDGPIICFNSRPSAWEFVTIYLSAVPSTSMVLRRLISSCVLHPLCDLMRERSVDFSVIDLDDGPSHSNSRRALRHVQSTSQEIYAGDTVLIVLAGPQQNAKISKMGNIVVVEQQIGNESEEDFRSSCIEVCQVLWAELASRYPTPSASKMVQYSSADAYAQRSEMQHMARSFVEWPSRAEVMERMVNFVSARLTEPTLAGLAGAHGSGKSYMLAALAQRVMTNKPHIQTIYYRHGGPQAYCPDAFASHICFDLVGYKEARHGVDTLTAALVQVASQRNILIVADGLDDIDQAMIRSCIMKPEIARLGGRVRVIYSARTPRCETDAPVLKAKPAFRLQALTSGECDEYLSGLCHDLKLPLTEAMKNTIVAKQQADVPLYLRMASHNIAVFCEFKAFQVEAPLKKGSLLRRLCQQLPGNLDYLIEDQVITLLECLYGQQLVRRVLEYLYYEESGLCVPDLTAVLAFHATPIERVPESSIASLCHDLLPFISSQPALPPSGHVCIDLRSVRRAIARRYFDEYVLDDRERRFVISRCLLAQKCSEEVDATLLAEESRDNLEESDFSVDLLSSDGQASEDENIFERDTATQRPYSNETLPHVKPEDSNKLPSPLPLSFSRHQSQPLPIKPGNSSFAVTRSQELRSGGSTPISGRRRKSMFPSASKTVEIIPLEQRKYESSLKEHVTDIHGCHDGVLCMAVLKRSSGDSYVCTGGGENDIKIWSFLCPATPDEEKVKQLRDDRDSNLQDLKDLFSSGEPGLKLHMRNYCLEAHVRCKLSGHRGSVVSIAADSSMLVSGSADHTIRLWNADTWKCTGTLVGHRSVVSALQFSFPNLYSAGHDGKIRAWNVDTRSCWASIDSAKRAAIHTINTKAGRLFVGLERRWDETMNSVKVWSMDLSTSLDELPSREMQQLVSSSKRSEKAVEDLDKRIVQLGLQSRKLTRSPVKIAELSNAMENAGESKERRLQQLSSIKEQIAQLKGDIFPADDIYCTHIEKCERTTREKADIIFVGGDTKPILAWDIEKMMCIEAMDGEHHHADYTRCFGSANGYLYSGGGKLKYQEKMAASSVAQKLKLEEEYNKLEEDVAASKLLDEKNCGRVTVWCTSTLKALGSMTFCSAVMSLAVSGDQLFVGDAGGNISIYAHHSCSEGFKAEIRAQVEQSARANLCVSSSFLSRREKLQSCKSITAIRGALVENTDDPALVTGLLMELGRALSQGGAFDAEEASGLKWIKAVQYEHTQGEELEHAELAGALACKLEFTWQEWEAFGISALRMDQHIKSGEEYFRPAQEAQHATLDCIFGVIERYKSLARLQVHALNVLSLCLNSSETALSYILSHKKLGCVSEMLRDDMKDCSILHRAGCLLYLEILSPLHVIPESHTVDDPTVPDKYRTRATGHQHGGIFDISSSSSPTSPATRNVPELASAEGARSPVAAELQVTQRHFGDEGISSTVSAEGSREEYNDAKRGVDRKHHHHQMVHSKTLVRGIQLENANLVIESGGLLALLSSFQGYARPGCEVDSKGQADTSVLEAAVPLLRFLAVQRPKECHNVVAQVGTDALDQLQDSLIDEKTKLDKANLLRDNNPLHALFADLSVAQGSMGIKIRGRPVPKPVVRHEPTSELLGGIFVAHSAGRMPAIGEQGSAQRRPTFDTWSVILKASNKL